MLGRLDRISRLNRRHHHHRRHHHRRPVRDLLVQAERRVGAVKHSNSAGDVGIGIEAINN